VVLALALGLTGSTASGAPAADPLAQARTRVGSPAAYCSVKALLVPQCGAWFGGDRHKAEGQKWDQAIDDEERLTGRRLDIVHNYHPWDDYFPYSSEIRRADNGQLLLLNWLSKSVDGTVVSWHSIASGSEDAQIDETAARLKAVGRPLFLTFQHEPEDKINTPYGTESDYIAAFRHVHDRVVAQGATNIVWVWTVMGLTSTYWQSEYPLLYPGDDYVDWIAWDPYNWAGCRSRPWRSFGGIVTPFYNYLLESGHGNKPFMLAEYGTVEKVEDPFGKAAWFQREVTSLPSFPRLKAVVYFDFPTPPASCDWMTDTSSASVTAYAKLAHSTYLNQPRP